MSLYRVIWEIDVEASDPENAAVNARDAFAQEQSCGQITVVEFRGDEVGEAVIVRPAGLVGPHPGVPLRKVVSFNPNRF